MDYVKDSATSTSIWMDCDPGHDDAFAILLATQSPEINLLGISIVHGNDNVEHCGLNAKRFLWACGVVGVPVYLGAERPLIRTPKFCPEVHGVAGEQGVAGMCGFHFPDEQIFSKEEYRINKGHGVLKMHEALMKSTRTVTIVATGAQTNVALLLRMFPEVTKKVERIVFMGGAIGLGNTGVAAEFNIEIDPEAAHIVFHSGIPLVMIPLEVTHTVLVTDEILAQVCGIQNCKFDNQDSVTQATFPLPHCHVEYKEISRLVASKFDENDKEKAKTQEDIGPEPLEKVSPFANCCHQLLSFFKSSYKEIFSFSSPPLHDPCTIFYLMNPEAFESIHVYVDVETGSEKCFGRTLVDIHGVTKKTPNITVCTGVDSNKFWMKMLQCIQIADSKSPLLTY